MKPRVPDTEDGVQIFVEHMSPSLQEEMCPFGRPLHLLTFHQLLTHDAIDDRFHTRCTDGVPLAIAFAEVGDERLRAHKVVSCVDQ